MEIVPLPGFLLGPTCPVIHTMNFVVNHNPAMCNIALNVLFVTLAVSSNGPSEAAARQDRPCPSTTAFPRALAKSDWSCIRAIYEAGKHKIFAVEQGWRAKNPGQGWLTSFDGRGFCTKPDDNRWTWGLDLTSYGWGATNPVTTPRATSTDGGRLSRAWDNVLTEWYVNDSRGLEHGFTVASRPSSVNAPLNVDLSIRGGLHPVVSQDGRHVAFTDAYGCTALNYNGLTVVDSAGQTVSAKWYPVGDNQLRLEVNDTNAVYPITIDPIAQQAYVKASNTSADDRFGDSVAVSGNTVVVAAPSEDSAAIGVNGNQADNSAATSGSVYVFTKQAGIWVQEAYLKASNTQAGDVFGSDVAISGDTIVVGAFGEDSGATGVNSNQADNGAPDSGAAYVFVRSNAIWSQQAYLKASNTDAVDFFGVSVAIDGETVVIGAFNESSGSTGVNGNQADNIFIQSGAAYIFARSGGVWSQQAYLKASNTGVLDSFGSSVAVSGDTVVVGAFAESSNAKGVNGNQANDSAFGAGAAYVFVRSGGTWSQQAYLKASNSGASDWFGTSVAISGNTVVVGASGEDSNATGLNGNQANNSASESGAAYVFVRTGGVWSQQAYLKASNTGTLDGFGCSVAVSGDTVVVGALSEDSNATGVQGNQANNTEPNSGAAYVFVRVGGVWSQQTYLKASNSGSHDEFGRSVSVSGDLMVVGAPLEDSNANGFNGNQADNSATDSGAAYIFDLDNNPGTASYGTGTPGCAGPHTLDVTHAPMIISPNFAITCTNAPPLSLGLGLVTDSKDLGGSVVFGLGVLLHVDFTFATEVISFDFFSDATGYSETVGASIPNEPLLIGKTYYACAVWYWTTCSLPPLNLSSSNGLAITILAP